MSILNYIPESLLAEVSHLPGMSALKYLYTKRREPKQFTEKDQRAIDAAKSKQARKAAKRLEQANKQTR